MARRRTNPYDRIVADFLHGEALPTSAPHACPYLADQVACSQGLEIAAPMSPDMHQSFIDVGFRRSGRVIYKPTCPGCKRCIPIRVPVNTFHPSRSMRRICRRNTDITVEPGALRADARKHDLFVRYLDSQHDGTMSADYDDFEQFLYESPTPTDELLYYAGRRLVGVSIVDRLAEGLSSVYMFFDPAERKRSLGTYSIIYEIQLCRESGFAYYYLGYWVPGSKTMAYKARFWPAEVLDAANQWIPLADWESDSSLATLPTA